MNFRHLAYFKALAETSSFTAAAKECGVSQPGLSSGIRELEEDLGVRLFYRNTRMVSLTAKGSELLPLITVALVNAGRAERDIRDLANNRHRPVRVAAAPAITGYLLPLALKRLASVDTNIDVLIMDAPDDEIADLVQEGHADLGLGSGHFDGEIFHRKSVFSVSLSVVLAKIHPLANRDEIRWRDIVAETIAVHESERSLQQMISKTVSASFVSYAYRETMLGMAACGQAIIVTPEISVQQMLSPELELISLIEPKVNIEYYIVYKGEVALKAEVVSLFNYLAMVLPVYWKETRGPVA